MNAKSYNLTSKTSLERFRESLPSHPYCTDELGFLWPRVRSNAALKKYIQPNGPTHLRWLVFDIDYPRFVGMLTSRMIDAQLPNFVAINPDNQHCHAFYELNTPVRTASNAKQKPLSYCKSVYDRLGLTLGADAGYIGLICKNPLNAHWEVIELHNQTFDLQELEISDYVINNLEIDPFKFNDYETLKEIAAKREKWLSAKLNAVRDDSEWFAYGRNCGIFKELALWAKKAIRQGWPPEDRFFNACYDRATMINNQYCSDDQKGLLPDKELRTIARSVSRWTCANITPGGFSESQARKGAKGGRKSKRKPVASSEASQKPWEALGISRATYYRQKKS